MLNPPIANTARELFMAIDRQLVQAHVQVRDHGGATDVVDASVKVHTDTLERIAASSLPDGPQAAREAALQALAGGMLCGALDGVIILTANRSLPHPPEFSGRPFQQLQQAVVKTRGVARSEWAASDPDNIQLLAAYGKHQNRTTEVEAESVLAGGPSPADWQAYLLGCFKAGYAIGMIDAVIVCVAGQTPDPLPEE